MEKKSHYITVSQSADYQPRIILKGKWLRDWEYTTGIRIRVERTSCGDILIRKLLTAAEPVEQKQIPLPALTAAPALSPLLSLKPTHLSLREQLIKATREYNANTRARTGLGVMAPHLAYTPSADQTVDQRQALSDNSQQTRSIPEQHRA